MLYLRRFALAAIVLLMAAPCFAAGSVIGYITDYHDEGLYESEIFACKTGATGNTAYYRCQTSGYYELTGLQSGTYSLGLNDSFHFRPRLRSFVGVQDGKVTAGDIHMQSTYYVRGYYLNAGTGLRNEIRQTFKATGDVVKVTFWMPNWQNLNVSIHNASTGTQIGPTRVAGQLDRGTAKWLHGEVPVTPGTLYYVKVTKPGGGAFDLYCNTNQSGNLYPDGQAYYDGVAQPTVDIGMTIESDDDGLATMYQRGMNSGGQSSTELGQTFKALAPSVNVVTIYATAFETNGTDVQFSIHAGGPGGAQIGTTKTVRVRDYRPMGQMVAVTWEPGEITGLTVGQTYYLKMASSGFYIFSNTSNPYADGCMYVGGSARTGDDILATIAGETSTYSSMGTISGTVTNTDGTPIAGATISSAEFGYSTTTDSNGNYSLRMTADTYTVTCKMPFYNSVTTTVNLDPGESEALNFNLTYTGNLLSNGNFEFGFTNGLADHWTKFLITNDPEFRDEGTWKYAGSHAQRWWTSWYTHDAGIYQQVDASQGTSYTASAWTYRVDSTGGNNETTWIGIDPYGGTSATSGNVVWSSGANSMQTWTQQSVTTTAQASTITVFVRGAASAPGQTMVTSVDEVMLTGPATKGTISGYVKDTNNNAVSGATVSTGTGWYSTTSAADGSYTLSNVVPGVYSVTASKTGYQPQTNTGVSVNAGNTTTNNFSLTRLTGTISGYVRDTSSNPIAGATVSTNTGGYSTTSNADGSYTLSNVTVGTYNVTASKTAYQSQTINNVSVTSGQTTTVNFSLTLLTGTISGYVRDTSSNPISGATVSTSTGGYSTTSAGDGSYTLSNVVPGTYNVTATKSGYQSQTQTGVGVTANQTTTCNFSLTPDSNLLTNGDFEGGFTSGVANGWTTWASGWSNTISYADSTNPVHGGSHAQRWGRSDNLRLHGGICQAVSVTPGTTYKISGWVRFTSTEPATWLEVGYDQTGQTSNGEAGTITYTKLESGGQNTWLYYEQTVQATGSSLSMFFKFGHYNQGGAGPCYAYADDARIEVAPTGTISGYVRNTGGTGISGVTVSTNTGGYSTTTAGDGSYTLSGVVPGTYNVTASKTGYISSTQSNKTVTAGQTTTVHFTLSIAAEDFTSMPSWSSSYNASWGSAATWSIVAGGQSGNFLQVSRPSQGSSSKAKVYTVPANTNITISAYMKCPSYGGAYWMEYAYRLGNYTAQSFDQDAGNWTLIKKFSDSGTNGNGNTWTKYTATVNTGANTQISIGYKLGSYACSGPTVGWDTFRIE